MKVVINRCFGGFSISEAAARELGVSSVYAVSRTDPRLISLIESKGTDYCSGSCARLKVVEIPDDIEWEINDYDGKEAIEEVHRTWC